MAETRRQSIARALRTESLTLLEVARRFRVPVKVALSDIEHILRSLRGGERLVLREAECLSCGYVFRERTRLNTPSRCPRCRSENIGDPEFTISRGDN